MHAKHEDIIAKEVQRAQREGKEEARAQMSSRGNSNRKVQQLTDQLDRMENQLYDKDDEIRKTNFSHRQEIDSLRNDIQQLRDDIRKDCLPPLPHTHVDKRFHMRSKTHEAEGSCW